MRITCSTIISTLKHLSKNNNILYDINKMAIVLYIAQFITVEVDFWIYQKVFDCRSYKSRSKENYIDVQIRMYYSLTICLIKGVCA
jgi:hypothetical protein